MEDSIKLMTRKHAFENKVLPWRRESVLKDIIPNQPGIYFFYGPGGQLLYTGHASRLRHRLQSYYQKDCFDTHKTKPDLRRFISYVRFDVMPKKQAMKKENEVKKYALFNFK